MTATATDFRAIFDPTGRQTARRLGCPVCGGTVTAGDCIDDRYGYGIQVRECYGCSLRYIMPRMIAIDYADLYASGAYRRLVSAYHGREMGGCEVDYALSVVHFLQGPRLAWERILDIGGAPQGIAVKWGLDADVIDPAIDGQTAETFDPAGRQWDLITVCQTVDHLLEPGAVFKKLAGCLALDGILFFDAVDFDATKEYKIDHPCNFNARSATMLAHVAGLRIDKMERSGNHLRYLCRHW